MEEEAGLCTSRTFPCSFSACMFCFVFVFLFVFFFVLFFLSFFFSSWCRGLAAVCDCGIPWTFLLTFL